MPLADQPAQGVELAVFQMVFKGAAVGVIGVAGFVEQRPGVRLLVQTFRFDIGQCLWPLAQLSRGWLAVAGEPFGEALQVAKARRAVPVGALAFKRPELLFGACFTHCRGPHCWRAARW